METRIDPPILLRVLVLNSFCNKLKTVLGDVFILIIDLQAGATCFSRRRISVSEIRRGFAGIIGSSTSRKTTGMTLGSLSNGIKRSFGTLFITFLRDHNYSCILT